MWTNIEVAALAGALFLGCAAKPYPDRGSYRRETGTYAFARGPKISLASVSGSSDEGMISFYAGEFHGRKTANGETFDKNALTAAHRTFPFGTRLRVTNLDNGKSVEVRVNDRGPFAKGRILDVSLKAAKKLEMVGKGTARAKVEVVD
jgi:rare lipoprotein A